MKTFTSKDLVKILIVDEQSRNDLLKTIDTADDSTIYEIDKVLWRNYFLLEEELTKIKYQQFLDEVSEKKRELSRSLYEQAEDAVHTDFENMLAGTFQEDVQMDELRAKLKTIAEQSQLQDLVNKENTVGTS